MGYRSFTCNRGKGLNKAAGLLSWQDLLSTSKEEAIVVGLDYAIVDVNARMLDHLGLPVESIVGLSCRQVLREVGITCAGIGEPRPVKLAVESGRRVSVVMRQTTPEGFRRNIEFEALPLKDVQGNLASVLCLFREIGVAEKYRRLFDSMELGVAMASRGGRFLDVNPALCDLLGYSRKEMAGKSAADFIPLELARALRRNPGKSSSPIEVDVARNDGSLLQTELVVQRLPAGSVTSYIGFVRDISRRKDREEHIARQAVALARSEADYKHGFDGAGEAWMTVEGDTKSLVRRNQELEVLFSVTALVSRSVDLDQMLQEILEKVLEVTGFSRGCVYLLDGARRQLFIKAHYGAETSILGAIDALDLGEGFSGRVAQTGEPLFIPDVAKDTRLTRAAVLDEGFKSLASIPLVSGGNVLGAMMMDAKDVRDFPPEMRRLLVSIGNEIGVAVERAQLLKRSQDRALELESLISVTREIVSTLDLQDVLDRSLAIICRQVGANQGFLCLLDEDKGKLTPRSFYGDRAALPGRVWNVGEGLVGWITQHQKSIITDDLPSDPRIEGSQGAATGMRASVGAPLRIKDRPLGVVIICSKEKAAFTEAHLHLVSAYAAEASMAIENALLHQAVKRQASTDELTHLANRRYFRQRLEEETMRAGRYRRLLSLLFLDVDGLKSINDRYGHAQGDLLLRHLADLMTSVARGTDVPARFGGDEFVILLPETSREKAVSVARRLISKATPCPLVSGGTIPWRVSIGIATAPVNGNYEVDLLGMADKAVYRAKLQGTSWEVAEDEET